MYEEVEVEDPDAEYEEIVVYEEVEVEDPDAEEGVEIVYEYVEVDEDAADEDGELVEVVEEIEEAVPVMEKKTVDPGKALVDIRTLEENFPDGATITLDKLKSVGLVLPIATKLHIYSSGPISKSFTIEANRFTMEAIRDIDSAGGNAMMTY